MEDQGLGQCPNVVLDLVNKAKLPKGSDVYFDNLFTSFPLLSQLSDLGIGGTGTLRQNRLFRVPIATKKNVEKNSVERGYNEAMYHEDQVLAVWKDNKAVYMASNKWDIEPFTTCRRFSRVQKKTVNVPVPGLVQKYNRGMGGVDLLDNLVACYRIPYRTKKWWFPLYSWSLSTSSVNAWRLRQSIRGIKEPYLDFLRELVIEMFNKHGTVSVKRRVTAQVGDERFDGRNHWIVGIINEAGAPHRKNCKYCYMTKKANNKTVYMCKKCNTALHTHCFEPYHTKWVNTPPAL